MNENHKRMLNIKQVAEISGLSRTTLWRLEKREDFPCRRQLSPRRVGWVESEVIEWLEAKVAV